MLAAVSHRYPVVFRECISFFSKTNARIGFLIPENIRIEIIIICIPLVCSCKIFENILFFIYAGGHLGFRHFWHFPKLEKNANPFFLNLLSQNQVKNQF